MTKSLFTSLLGLVAFIGTQPAKADLVTITGNLSSDGSAVGSGDPVLTDQSINLGDPFSISLTYSPGSATHSGNSYLLTDALLSLTFDGFTFDYSAPGNYIAFFTPGAYGPETASFQTCSASDCQSDFMNLYFTGTVTDLSSLAAQASGLVGDSGASPSEFEFLRNFSDGSQTDLQGTLNGAAGFVSTPEPEALSLDIGVLLLVWAAYRRKFAKRTLQRQD